MEVVLAADGRRCGVRGGEKQQGQLCRCLRQQTAGGVWGRGVRRQQGQLWRSLRQQPAGDVGAEVEKTARTALEMVLAAHGWRFVA
jgi:hypothetical protein